jgi:hypothetical protein
LLGMSLSPCCRFHPAEVVMPYRSDFGTPCCLHPSVAGSALGATHFRGHIHVHCCYGPVTRSLPKGDLVDRLQDFGFPPPCYPNYGAPDYCPGRLNLLLNTPAFTGHTTGRADLRHPACMGLSLSRGITPFLSSLSFHSFVRVRRETGKKSVVRVHHGEGVAIHIDPESCADAREGVGEALTGERIGQAIEP